MTERYREIMEHIEVTSALRQRILQNIETKLKAEAPFKTASVWAAPRFGLLHPRVVKLLLGTAATVCLIILLWSQLPGLRQPPVTETRSSFAFGTKQVTSTEANKVMQPGGPLELTAPGELEAVVGFKLLLPQKLVTAGSDLHYAAIGPDLAQVSGQSGRQNFVFRQGRGSFDVSGDYSQYSSVIEAEIASVKVTLKGSGNRYELAVWEKQGFSFSLALSEAWPENNWREILTPMMQQAN